MKTLLGRLPARLLRFAVVGGVCSLLQLGLLASLLIAGLAALPAGVIAYLASAQANFALSNFVIWKDRWPSRRSAGAIPWREQLIRRWAEFHASIAATFLLSQAIFLVARAAVPSLIAAALGLSVSAVANYLVQDRLTFAVADPRRFSSASHFRRLP